MTGTTRSRRIFLLLGAFLALVTVAGCGDSPSGGGSASAPDYEAKLRGSPPKLAALHRQGSELLGGGADAFKARVKDLHGYPVVVNKWASWCGPCRVELPWFQRQAARRGKKVAFLGVDSNDSSSAARRFQEEFPVPYPSYSDPKLEVAKVFDAPTEFPATAFYSSKGKLSYVRRGAYGSQGELEADIERYAN